MNLATRIKIYLANSSYKLLGLVFRHKSPLCPRCEYEQTMFCLCYDQRICCKVYACPECGYNTESPGSLVDRITLVDINQPDLDYYASIILGDFSLRQEFFGKRERFGDIWLKEIDSSIICRSCEQLAPSLDHEDQFCDECHDIGVSLCEKCDAYFCNDDLSISCTICSEPLVHDCKAYQEYKQWAEKNDHLINIDYDVSHWYCKTQRCIDIARHEADQVAHEDFVRSEAARKGRVCSLCDGIGCSPERHERGF